MTVVHESAYTVFQAMKSVHIPSDHATNCAAAAAASTSIMYAFRQPKLFPSITSIPQYGATPQPSVSGDIPTLATQPGTMLQRWSSEKVLMTTKNHQYTTSNVGYLMLLNTPLLAQANPLLVLL